MEIERQSDVDMQYREFKDLKLSQLGFGAMRLPGVKVILSGMSNEEQLHAIVATFEADLPLNDDEMKALMQVAAQMADEKSVPCTACHYCTDHCPQGLDIPHLIELYNEHTLTTKAGLFGFIAPMALAAIP